MPPLSRLLLISFSLLVSASLVLADDLYTPVLRAQVALDILSISPGVIDGLNGPNTAGAVFLFQKLHGLPPTGALDESTQTLLDPLAQDRLVRYTVTQADLDGLAHVPDDWVSRSRMSSLPYENLLESLAERSHASQNLLCRLNPDVVWNNLKSGDSVFLLDFPPAHPPSTHHLEISLSQKTVRAVSEDDKLLAFFHCSIAQEDGERPQGTLLVTTVLLDPPYAFDPRLWPESGLTQKLAIPPGPNNPVGSAWIGLDKPGYGIHGTPDPESVGRTGSHGCFRLTNWDVRKLAAMVHKGVPVIISP